MNTYKTQARTGLLTVLQRIADALDRIAPGEKRQK